MQNLPKLSMYIDGRWVAPASGEYIETVDPFTARPWALVPRGNAEDADRAVRAAHRAFSQGPWGGAATTPAPPDRRAFSHASANLPFEDEQDFHLGKALFEKLWVSSPSSTQASDGLGPLYNARACESCHVRDGRGRPPEGAVDATSMLFRLARAPRDDAERAEFASHARLNFPDPVYGAQLQDSAVPGLAAEGRLDITYTEEPVTLAGGA